MSWKKSWIVALFCFHHIVGMSWKSVGMWLCIVSTTLKACHGKSAGMWLCIVSTTLKACHGKSAGMWLCIVSTTLKACHGKSLGMWLMQRGGSLETEPHATLKFFLPTRHLVEEFLLIKLFVSWHI